MSTVAGDVNLCSHHEKQYRSFSKNLKIEQLYDPAITLLGIYWKETQTLTQEDTCTSMFLTTLFTVDREAT